MYLMINTWKDVCESHQKLNMILQGYWSKSIVSFDWYF